MKIELMHRRLGVLTPLKEAEVAGEFDDYATARGGEQGAYTIDEDTLLAALPHGFLPVPASQVLLTVADKQRGTWQDGLSEFRDYAKYFDAYVLVIVKAAPDAPDHEDAAEPSPAELVRVTALNILRDIYAAQERVTVVDLGDPSWAGPRSDDPAELMAAMPDAYTVRVVPRWDNVGVIWCGRFGFDQDHRNRPYPDMPHSDPGFRDALAELVEPLVREALDAAQRARLADYANDAPGDVYQARDAIRPLKP